MVGGFGTVYKCKDAMQKRFVAVKLVNGVKNAQAAMRECQKLNIGACTPGCT